jgi:hypothetical protein
MRESENMSRTAIPTTQLDRDESDWAAEMSPADRFIAGARLFDAACRVTMSGIRKQHPGASDAEVLAILRERLEWSRRWEEGE